MIRVIIADDHAVVRHGLRLILSTEPDIELVGAVSDGEELLAVLDTTPCDVVVLDVRMPGMTGLVALPLIKARHPEVNCVVLSIYPEDQFAIRALKAGASGYLTKETAPDELVDAIRKASQGRRYVSPALAEQLAEHVAGGSAQPALSALTEREEEVMRAIATGRTVSEIAEELNLSVKTVSTHRTHILDKLGLRNNAEIMRYALDQGLVV